MRWQGSLDQHGVVAVLQRAEQLAASGARPPLPADQYACARLLESAAMSAAPLVPAMAPATVAALLGAFGALVGSGMVVRRYVPYMLVALVQALILASLTQLRAYSPGQLVCVLRGCALLSPGGVPEVWLREWQAACGPALLRGLTPGALAAVMGHLALLRQRQGWVPPQQWLQGCLEAAQAKLAECSGHDLREVIVALAGMEMQPPEGWLAAFRAVLDRRVAAGMQADDIAGVLYAFRKLELSVA